MTHQLIMNAKAKKDADFVRTDLMYECEYVSPDDEQAVAIKNLFNKIKEDFKPGADMLTRLEYKSPSEYFYHDYNGNFDEEEEEKDEIECYRVRAGMIRKYRGHGDHDGSWDKVIDYKNLEEAEKDFEEFTENEEWDRVVLNLVYKAFVNKDNKIDWIEEEFMSDVISKSLWEERRLEFEKE